MEESVYDGTINNYLQTKGNNKPYCVIYEEEDEINEINQNLDFSTIETIDLTIRITGKKFYSIILPETITKLTIEMLSDTFDPFFPKLITTSHTTQLYDITFSSINSNKQIISSIPSSITSVSFMSCRNITIQQDILSITSLEISESESCNIISKETTVEMKEKEIIINNIESILLFDIPSKIYTLNNVIKANITSTENISINSSTLKELILSFEIILEQSMEIDESKEKQILHLDKMNIETVELNGMKYMDCYLPITLQSLVLSYCNMLSLLTEKPFINEVDISTEECIDCQLNHVDLPSNKIDEDEENDFMDEENYAFENDDDF